MNRLRFRRLLRRELRGAGLLADRIEVRGSCALDEMMFLLEPVEFQPRCAAGGSLPACINCDAGEGKPCVSDWCPAADNPSYRSHRFDRDWMALAYGDEAPERMEMGGGMAEHAPPPVPVVSPSFAVPRKLIDLSKVPSDMESRAAGWKAGA